jgi:hypothetical protein
LAAINFIANRFERSVLAVDTSTFIHSLASNGRICEGVCISAVPT